MKDKKMTAIISPTLRGLVKQVNQLGIQQEDIVSIENEGGQYFLIYYSKEV